MKESNSNYNEKEKKIIIYLIIIFLVLIYFSLFFIHNIVYKGIIKDNETVFNPENITDNNEKEDKDETVYDTENIVDNNQNILNSYNPEYNNGNILNPDNTEDNNENISNPDNIVNNNDRFRVLESAEEWSELKELNIFENNYFNDRIIAPGVHGTYNFTIENYGDTNLEYNINFSEENIAKINMVYKLKLNGSYVAGNEEKWVKYDKLNMENIIINSQKNDLFTIEWKWQDSENDTKIGETEDADYKLKVKVKATSLEE